MTHTTSGALSPTTGPRSCGRTTPTTKLWTLYILRMADNSLYCGITTNLEKRLKAHDAGPPKGSKYVHSHKPYDLVMHESVESKSTALRMEAAFKKLSKAKKEAQVYEFVKKRGREDARQDEKERKLFASVGGDEWHIGDELSVNEYQRPYYITEFDEAAYFDGYGTFANAVIAESNLAQVKGSS